MFRSLDTEFDADLCKACASLLVSLQLNNSHHLNEDKQLTIDHLRLTCGCTLLPSGAIADIVGNRPINLAGTLGSGVSILAAALAASGPQLIVFRGLQGVAMAMCFPTSVSILSSAFPTGSVRNIAFGCLGLGTPLGFAIGILVGGWFESTSIGWRPGFYGTAVLNMILFAVNYWCLPHARRTENDIWARLKQNIDWIGVLISSVAMGLLSYSLA